MAQANCLKDIFLKGNLTWCISLSGTINSVHILELWELRKKLQRNIWTPSRKTPSQNSNPTTFLLQGNRANNCSSIQPVGKKQLLRVLNLNFIKNCSILSLYLIKGVWKAPPFIKGVCNFIGETLWCIERQLLEVAATASSMVSDQKHC